MSHAPTKQPAPVEADPFVSGAERLRRRHEASTVIEQLMKVPSRVYNTIRFTVQSRLFTSNKMERRYQRSLDDPATQEAIRRRLTTRPGGQETGSSGRDVPNQSQS